MNCLFCSPQHLFPQQRLPRRGKEEVGVRGSESILPMPSLLLSPTTELPIFTVNAIRKRPLQRREVQHANHDAMTYVFC